MSLFDKLWDEAHDERMQCLRAPDHYTGLRKEPFTGDSQLIERLRAEMEYYPPPPRSFVGQLERARATASASVETRRAAHDQARKLHKELSARAGELAGEIAACDYASITRPAGWRPVATRLAALLVEREAVARLLALVPVELLAEVTDLAEDPRPRMIALLRAWRARLGVEKLRLQVEVAAVEAATGDELDRRDVLNDVPALFNAICDADDNLQAAEQEPTRYSNREPAPQTTYAAQPARGEYRRLEPRAAGTD